MFYLKKLQNKRNNNTDSNTYKKRGCEGAFAACWGRIGNEYQRAVYLRRFRINAYRARYGSAHCTRPKAGQIFVTY